jgi:hypothetical protein
MLSVVCEYLAAQAAGGGGAGQLKYFCDNMSIAQDIEFEVTLLLRFCLINTGIATTCGPAAMPFYNEQFFNVCLFGLLISN